MLCEKKEFDWLIGYIKESSQPLHILSMPCSSGEDVCSILLLMSEAGISLHKIPREMREKYFDSVYEKTWTPKNFLKSKPFFEQKNIFDLNGSA